MSHSVTSANGSYDEKQIDGSKEITTNYSCPLQVFIFVGWEGRVVGGGGRLFEAGRLLNFPPNRMGAYSRRELIWGWALNRINTVFVLNRVRVSNPQRLTYGRVIPGLGPWGNKPLTFPRRRRKFSDDAIRTLTKIRSPPEYISLLHFLFKFTNQTEVCINCSNFKKKTRLKGFGSWRHGAIVLFHTAYIPREIEGLIATSWIVN